MRTQGSLRPGPRKSTTHAASLTFALLNLAELRSSLEDSWNDSWRFTHTTVEEMTGNRMGTNKGKEFRSFVIYSMISKAIAAWVTELAPPNTIVSFLSLQVLHLPEGLDRTSSKASTKSSWLWQELAELLFFYHDTLLAACRQSCSRMYANRLRNTGKNAWYQAVFRMKILFMVALARQPCAFWSSSAYNGNGNVSDSMSLNLSKQQEWLKRICGRFVGNNLRDE